jgi:hypothetical protein
MTAGSLSNLRDQQHVRTRTIEDVIVLRELLEDGGSEGSERFAVLDPCVEHILVLGHQWAH